MSASQDLPARRHLALPAAPGRGFIERLDIEPVSRNIDDRLAAIPQQPPKLIHAGRAEETAPYAHDDSSPRTPGIID